MMVRIAGWMMLWLTLSVHAGAAALDEAGESAAMMLRQAMTPRQDGAHESLLEALRRLHDPAMRPLFEHLAAAPQASLQMHGLLGLAEIDPSRRLPLRAIGELEHAPLQAELIAAAMDDDLLDPADARQLLDWPGLSLPVKLVVATRLIEAGSFDRADLLLEGLTSDKLGQRGLAALLLHQLGDPRGDDALRELDGSPAANRDAVRSELLRTIVRHKFQHAGDWAFAIAEQPDVDPTLKLSALAVAMRFGQPGAADRWRKLYAAAEASTGQRRLLALMALRVAPYCEAGLFDELIDADDALIGDIGQTGRAIAAGSSQVATAATSLLRRGHPLVNNWALAYAEHEARPDLAQFLLLAMIESYQPGDDEADRISRLDDAAKAAMRLMAIDPAAGSSLLRPIVAAPTTQVSLRQALLLGLLRVNGPDTAKVIEGLHFTDADAARPALLLRARDGRVLSAEEEADLRLIVRGGTKLQGTLRVQAAWFYLKRTDQIDAALRRLGQP